MLGRVACQCNTDRELRVSQNTGKAASMMGWLRLFILVQFSQIGASDYGSYTMLTVSYMVGDKAILPCSWSYPNEETLHVQWATSRDDTVFERRGNEKWQAPEFEGRVMVPEENLMSGNCSLTITDIEFRDAGRYYSYMLMETNRGKNRFFIQGVEVIVREHNASQFLRVGEDMILQFYTRHAGKVLFQPTNTNDTEVYWDRSKSIKTLTVSLTVKVDASAQGIYKVLDQDGVIVNTVQLYVEEPRDSEEEYFSTDAAVKDSWLTLLIVGCLLIPQTLQL